MKNFSGACGAITGDAGSVSDEAGAGIDQTDESDLIDGGDDGESTANGDDVYAKFGGIRGAVLAVCCGDGSRVSRLAGMTWVASGHPGPPLYLLRLKTAAQAAQWFGVSLKTIGQWKARGCEGMSKGEYIPAIMLNWRRQQPEPLPWHWTGNRRLASDMTASGDMARGILRTVRGEIGELIGEAAPAIQKAIGGRGSKTKAAEVVKIILAALAPLRLTDEEIEELLVESWKIV